MKAFLDALEGEQSFVPQSPVEAAHFFRARAEPGRFLPSRQRLLAMSAAMAENAGVGATPAELLPWLIYLEDTVYLYRLLGAPSRAKASGVLSRFHQLRYDRIRC